MINGSLKNNTTQYDVDKFLFIPLYKAGQLAKTTQTGASIMARLLCVSQAIVSLVALPFKFIFSLFLGLYTFYNDSDETVNRSGYALLSAGIHAMAIPTTILLTLFPSSAIATIPDLARETQQEIARNSNMTIG